MFPMDSEFIKTLPLAFRCSCISWLSKVELYRLLRRFCCLSHQGQWLYPDDGGIRILSNVDTLYRITWHHNTAEQTS